MRRPTLAPVLMLVALASAGCSYLMPPQKIPMDRENYLEAVSTSWKEQLLTNLVRQRYGDTLTSLEMTSVTTSYQLDAGLNANYPIAWHQDPAASGFRNVVGIGGSVGYSDKPSISYVPMRGDVLSKNMIDPLPGSNILKSLQTNWDCGWIFSCCVDSINTLQNRTPSCNFKGDFFDSESPLGPGEFSDFYKRLNILREYGIVRITVKETKEPKVTKVPEEFTVTLIKKDQSQTEPGLKGKVKPKEGGKTRDENDNNKKQKSVTPIGSLIWDKAQADKEKKRIGEKIAKLKKWPQKDEGKISNLEYILKALDLNTFRELLWPQCTSASNQEGKNLYNMKCLSCHGAKGDGKGLITTSPNPADFTDPMFSEGNVDLKIKQAIQRGKAHKDISGMETDVLNALTNYIKQAFGNYEVYNIFDGNENPPQSDPSCDKIVIKTRSVFTVIYMLAQFIDIPKEEINAKSAYESSMFDDKGNLTEPLFYNTPDENGTPGGNFWFVIRQSKDRPKDAFVAINYHKNWFFIEDKDRDSKNAFSNTVVIMSMGESGTAQGTPVLTLPVQ
jgi:cytochrome c